MNIGKVLKELRRSSGLTQGELADALDDKINRITLSRMESSNSGLTNKNLGILADFYDINISDIYKSAETELEIDLKVKKDSIPLLDWGSIHTWLHGDKSKAERLTSIPAQSGGGRNSFALIVADDPTQDTTAMPWPQGTVAIIDPERTPDKSNFALVMLKPSDPTSYTLAQIKPAGIDIYLRPLDSQVQPYKLPENAIISGLLSSLRWETPPI